MSANIIAEGRTRLRCISQFGFRAWLRDGISNNRQPQRSIVLSCCHAGEALDLTPVRLVMLLATALAQRVPPYPAR